MIYVDARVDREKMIGRNGPYWSHMGTDDHSPAGMDALHAFAKRLGLKRAWFQDKPTHPHYDLTANKHALALSYGATLVTCKEFVTLCAPVLWARATSGTHLDKEAQA